MRIKWVTNGLSIKQFSTDDQELECWLNLSVFFIKHYYDLKGMNPDVKWMLADLVNLDPLPKVIDRLQQDPPDVLALSVFIWNEQDQLTIAKSLKTCSPQTIIVLGGPQLTAHKDDQFFKSHGYVDYVVYGDGEKAMQQIIDFHSGLCDDSGFVNIVANRNDRYHLYPYERFVDEEYWSSSPYLGQKEFISKHINYLESRGVLRSSMIAGMEFARGCMYACTFCDWSQGLTHKVKRRQKMDWREDLHFFRDLDIAVRETDANFGQWPEDLEIYRYANSLRRPGSNFKFIAWNTPKLKPEATTELLRENAQQHGQRIILVMQDINQDVLKKMDRPSLSWERYKKIIEDLRQDLGPDTVKDYVAQLMLGVAGQSFESMSDTMYRIWTETGIHEFGLNHWLLLPNSPGADAFYNRLHGLQWKTGYELFKNPITGISDLAQLYDIASKKNDAEIMWHLRTTKPIWATGSMNYRDMIACQILAKWIGQLAQSKLFANRTQKGLTGFFKKIKVKSLAAADEHFDMIEPLVQRYGFLILGRYDARSKSHYPRWNIPLT